MWRGRGGRRALRDGSPIPAGLCPQGRHRGLRPPPSLAQCGQRGRLVRGALHRVLPLHLAPGTVSCPLPGSFCWEVTAAPSHGPRWALPGPDPDEPRESKFRAGPVSHGLRPLLPSPAQRQGGVRPRRELGRSELSSRLFSIRRWPKGHLVAANVPSERCQRAPCPRDAPAPSPCGKLISQFWTSLFAVGQPGLGHRSRLEVGRSRDKSQLARAVCPSTVGVVGASEAGEGGTGAVQESRTRLGKRGEPPVSPEHSSLCQGGGDNSGAFSTTQRGVRRFYL